MMNKPQVRKAIEDILGDVFPQKDMQRLDCDIHCDGLEDKIYYLKSPLNSVQGTLLSYFYHNYCLLLM
ncbi:MAG: hypothetical protein PHZ03_11050 [Syntrophomonas sp.]|nr:hypothetical protein [Syntrophomonas sp.]